MVVLAARQGGAISTEQLRGLGLSGSAVSRLVAKGWLTPHHRGVFRQGALTPEGVLFAAALAVGQPCAIGHRAAANVHLLIRGRPPAVTDVTAPGRRRHRAGIRMHRAVLHRDDVTTRGGLPITTVARTLLDLAATEPGPVLQAAVDEARVRRELHPRVVEATIGRARGHHGIASLRRAVARQDPGRGRPWSELERLGLRFLRDRGFPPYVRNHPIDIDGERFTPDVVWPQQRVVLELDSRTYHDNDPDFARDRRRSRRLQAAGWPGIRATWADFEEHADELADDLWSLVRGV